MKHLEWSTSLLLSSDNIKKHDPLNGIRIRSASAKASLDTANRAVKGMRLPWLVFCQSLCGL
jgi:hypothetical protein